MYCTISAFLPQNLQEGSPDERVFLGGLLSVEVPSLIFLSLVSFFRCATESFLAYTPIVVIPAASLLSSEEAVVDLWSECNKPAELSASCLGLIFTSLVSIFDPTSAGELNGQHWQSPLYQCKATYSGMTLGFPEAPAMLRNIWNAPECTWAVCRATCGALIKRQQTVKYRLPKLDQFQAGF
jgi:hypothetical protein